MTTSRDKTRETIDLAIKTFADHQLFSEYPDANTHHQTGRWRIARIHPKGGIKNEYATEIISLWGGRLFVGGDIDDCVFAYYSDDMPKSDASYADQQEFNLRKLAWIGRCEDVGYYVAQKAGIGMTDGGKLAEVWDEDVARDDLKQMRETSKDELADNDLYHLDRIIRHVGNDARETWEELYLHGLHELVPSSLGKVTSPRVIYAWAACRRLCELIL